MADPREQAVAPEALDRVQPLRVVGGRSFNGVGVWPGGGGDITPGGARGEERRSLTRLYWRRGLAFFYVGARARDPAPGGGCPRLGRARRRGGEREGAREGRGPARPPPIDKGGERAPRERRCYPARRSEGCLWGREMSGALRAGRGEIWGGGGGGGGEGGGAGGGGPPPRRPSLSGGGAATARGTGAAAETPAMCSPGEARPNPSCRRAMCSGSRGIRRGWRRRSPTRPRGAPSPAPGAPASRDHR